MSLFNIFNVAGSAMSAQGQRLNTVASNLANADSVTSSNGQPYRPRHVIFAAVPTTANGAAGVRVQQVVEDQGPGKRVYEPQNPAADETGHVTLPNVNVVDEMVNMISATRAYQNNVEVMNSAKTMLQRTLTIGQ
jgi:flagellar basal-body rod protein FlgC